MSTETQKTKLRFVPAAAVEPSVVSFDALPVETTDRRRVGHLTGVVIDLLSRRLHYVVVESSRWAGRAACRLVPFSTGTIDTERKTLRIDTTGGDESWMEFESTAFLRLTGDELLIAVR